MAKLEERGGHGEVVQVGWKNFSEEIPVWLQKQSSFRSEKFSLTKMSLKIVCNRKVFTSKWKKWKDGKKIGVCPPKERS